MQGEISTFSCTLTRRWNVVKIYMWPLLDVLNRSLPGRLHDIYRNSISLWWVKYLGYCDFLLTLLDLCSFDQVTPEGLCSTSARKIFGDSWSICQSRTHRMKFPVISCDFGENRRFPGFGSADGHGIAMKMYVCMSSLSIRGCSAIAGLIWLARDVDFAKTAMISRSQFDAVHGGSLWVRLWQTNRGLPWFRQKWNFLWCVRMIAMACSVRHRMFCPKLHYICLILFDFVVPRGNLHDFWNSKIRHQNFMKIAIWPLLDVQITISASDLWAVGGF